MVHRHFDAYIQVLMGCAEDPRTFPEKEWSNRPLLPRILLILACDSSILDISKGARCLILYRVASCSLLYSSRQTGNRKTGMTKPKQNEGAISDLNIIVAYRR